MGFSSHLAARLGMACAALGLLVSGCSSESTSVPSTPQQGIYIQVDRLGRPGVKAVFENFTDHESTNRNSPYDDPVLKQSIANFAGPNGPANRTASTVTALQNIFALDELQLNTSASGSAGYLGIETGGSAFGGRALNDDSMDAILGATFGTKLTNDATATPCLATDNVGPTAAANGSQTFPYLASPN